ncbi:hypothetical protein BKA61DRAFT_658410 [Leptodontidium sp. MPI-SDFR-AT-0119]|nr:hypothetical protein BKA61DRAFT_658410 [Leptodontidium sp. MPI-SDFR-AT-0119]
MPHCYETCSPGPTVTIPLHQMPTTTPDFQRRLMASSHNQQSILTFLEKLMLWNSVKDLSDLIRDLLLRLNLALPPSMRGRVYFYSLQPEVPRIPLPVLNVEFVKVDTRPNESSLAKMILRSLFVSDNSALNQLILSFVIVVIVQFVTRTFFPGWKKGWLDEQDQEIEPVAVTETSKTLEAAEDWNGGELCVIGKTLVPGAEDSQTQD